MSNREGKCKPQTLLDAGDSLRGSRVLINARQLSKPRVINLTHRHEAQEIIARDNVYCVIEMPLAARPGNQTST